MATVSTLYQGLRDSNFHDDAIKNISELDDIEELILCAAFARSEGIQILLDEINISRDKISFYVGVRNGITTAQSISLLLKHDINIYCVDTGKSNVLFHPKVYLSKNESTAYAIVGSANLTLSGLTSNIETSISIKFDLTNQSDQEAYNDLREGVVSLPTNHSDNTTKIKNGREVVQMIKDGIVVDERAAKQSNNPRASSPQIKNSVAPIDSYRKNINISRKGRTNKELDKLQGKETVTSQDWILVWESNELKERHLNIPTGPNTNPTGSMLFTKGNMDDIDQRHYFRDVIFDELPWQNDDRDHLSHYERVVGDFQIVIKGVDFGIHTLKLSHNSDTTSKSYHQNNSMTQIHWGDARDVIAKRELLGEKLKLYRNAKKEDIFKIEIG
ncbi:HKD family nuclease [Fodinibius roseus]|uniref:HKD family nuclease n=1 Tax=Fodinibius roseus TaxID=1194090 RepID=A0A1M5KI49_9BACT|nr:phospholipase D family protein [Fodinibius roseus]SHG51863.1 HKD family nuclease [Fodinibius roseus]